MSLEENQVQQPTITMLRLPQVMAMTGLPHSSVYALIARNEFPKPVALSVNRVAWIESEVQHWLRARVDATRQPAAPTHARGCRPARAPSRVTRPSKPTTRVERPARKQPRVRR